MSDTTTTTTKENTMESLTEVEPKLSLKDAMEAWINSQSYLKEAERNHEKAIVGVKEAMPCTPNLKRLVRVWRGNDWKYHIVWIDDLGNPQYEVITEEK